VTVLLVRGSNMSNDLNSEQDLASIPMAGGGLSRLAIARLKNAGMEVAPLLKRAGLTPEVIADPEERLSVRSQVALLDEASVALKDDRLGFTLARDFDPRELGLLYYVMASSPTTRICWRSMGGSNETFEHNCLSGDRRLWDDCCIRTVGTRGDDQGKTFRSLATRFFQSNCW
jgi:hypothetical protein